ncbi:mRNA-decapping enzyme 1B-like [Mytilus californianus]|uniref:mRNA-decapping enzyme 1B-like n=1 Tax=Mytilus californianus TaxID=6549 RepID=UPI00224724F0|nr:mRNA-decapping enzyme 1B-like [Mytilus californianus]
MAEGRMNLAALQQRDPYITDIVDTASQVALYSFSSKSSEWERTEIEGSLFVYKRSASPTHGFMILNRLGLTNQIEPITKDLEFQLQDPFVLYRNSKAIYGIWFYDKDECARIGQMINSFLQVAIESHTTKTALRNRRASESDTMHDVMSGATRQVNIMQMLSKAQDEYDKSKKKPDPKPFIDNPNASATKSSDLIRPRPVKAGTEESDVDSNQNARPSSGPLTLETLFRNASMQQNQDQRIRSQTSVVETSKPPPTFHRSLSVTDTPKMATEEQESHNVPALLRHIMSSGSMVEDIERQHRGEITLTDTTPSSSLPNGGSYKILSKSKSRDLSQGESDYCGEPAKFSLSDTSCQFGTKNVTQDLTERFGDAVTINRLSDNNLRRTSPAENISANRQLQSSLQGVGRVGSAELLTPAALEKSSVSSSEKGSVPSTKQLTAAAASLNSDVLLSPMAFVRGSQKSPSSSLSDEQGKLNRSNDSGSSAEGSTSQLPVAALTKEQLQQAIVHLMKTDPSFINTLHEAYLSSLKELSKS